LIIAAVFGEAGQVGRWQILAGVAILAVSIGALAFLSTKLRRLYGNYLESLRVLAVVQRPEETDLWIPSPLP
jgi:hypothetical protein